MGIIWSSISNPVEFFYKDNGTVKAIVAGSGAAFWRVIFEKAELDTGFGRKSTDSVHQAGLYTFRIYYHFLQFFLMK
jgi:hypothetical protein